MDYKPVPVYVVMTNLTYALSGIGQAKKKVLVLVSIIHFNKPDVVTMIRNLNSQIGAFSCSYVFFCPRAAGLWEPVANKPLLVLIVIGHKLRIHQT